MWVFDGEEWTEEGGAEKSSTSEQKQQMRYEQFQPELQVVEVVIQVPKTNYVPHPLP
jgi:hypothetical protein